MNKKTIIDAILKCVMVLPMIGFAVSISFKNNSAILFFLGMLVMLEILLALSFFYR